MLGPQKITGVALAKACGVSPASVSDWLSGKSKTMEASHLLAAARACENHVFLVSSTYTDINRFTVTTNQPPVIANVAVTPATPTVNDVVWVTALVTDDASVSNVTLTYSTGSGGANQTNTVFLETMRELDAKPWTGDGCDHARRRDACR